MEGAGPVRLDEDLLLPCEFCDELFPQDVLVQHQVTCQFEVNYAGISSTILKVGSAFYLCEQIDVQYDFTALITIFLNILITYL